METGKNQFSYERNRNIIKCYLQLQQQPKKLIGTIDTDSRTFSKRIFSNKHCFHKSDSIAIANELLKLCEYDKIVILCDTETYTTSKDFFVKHSEYRNFKGYELQKFMSRSLFGEENLKIWEMQQEKKNSDVLPVKRNKNLTQLALF